MKISSGIAVTLLVVPMALSVGCGDSDSPTDLAEPKQILLSAVDAIDAERSVRFELQFNIDGQGPEPTADELDWDADLIGNYEAGGRIALSGTAHLFGGEFDGRYLNDPRLAEHVLQGTRHGLDVVIRLYGDDPRLAEHVRHGDSHSVRTGSFAYDRTEDRWYGDKTFNDPPQTPEDELREIVLDVLLNGYPATLADRRSFSEPLVALVKRAIDLYGGDAVVLSIDEVTASDGAEASAITFEPQPDEIVNIVHHRGTNDPQVDAALDAMLPEVRPRIVIGNADHLPRELTLSATFEDGLEESGLEESDRVDVDFSLRLSDWGASFDIDPPKRFDDLDDFAPFGHPFD